jgi:SAM-dependent methyltransferase
MDYMRKVYPAGCGQALNLKQPLEVPPVSPVKTTWEKATEFESDWWGLEPNERWNEEVAKQHTYAKLMELPDDLDLGKPTKVLDIGCGPTSMLLRADRHGAKAVGVDPLPVSKNTLQRYKAANVQFINKKAEEGIPNKKFDEVWLYNVLQHTEDPSKILEQAAKVGSLIRIFEWVNTPPHVGHPHTLTEALFAKAFEGWDREKWDVGTLNDTKMLYGDYIALVVKKPKD